MGRSGRLLGKGQDLAHLVTVLGRSELPAINRLNLAFGNIGTETPIHRFKICENSVNDCTVNRCGYIDCDRHTHEDSRSTHRVTMRLVSARRQASG
jgi:hypothetical protein